MNTPYYTYEAYRGSFVIVDPAGDFLIADQLPSTEQEAKQLCRVANMARDHAITECVDCMGEAVRQMAKSQ